MTHRRLGFFALGAVAGIGIGAVTNLIAQSAYPVRFDNSQAAVSYRVEGEVRHEASVALATPPGASALTVEGEVRTVDSTGHIRLWGRGRPGTDVYLSGSVQPSLCNNGSTKFGVSTAVADWGSADHACPAGFWVCTAAERGTGSCVPVQEPRSLDCEGAELTTTFAWLAGAGAAPVPFSGRCLGDQGGSDELYCRPCLSLPVWCCTE